MISASMAVSTAPAAAISKRATDARQARLARFLAMVIDLVVFGILSSVVNNVYGVTQVTSGSPIEVGASTAFFTTATTVAWPWLVVLWMAYFIVPEGLFGASFGKILNGLCVVRIDGAPITFGSIVIRNVLRLIDVLPGAYLLGGVLVLVSGGSQRLGDLVAGTTVIRRVSATSPHATRHPARGARRVLGLALVAALLFTIAFDYFGRAPLVLEGLFNQHQLMEPDLSSYQLGTPQWELGRVTYPLTGFSPAQTCRGTISLNWDWTGWEMSDGQFFCQP
jgi:uncharacterized RDD family membrane protein YckC